MFQLQIFPFFDFSHCCYSYSFPSGEEASARLIACPVLRPW